MSSTTTTTQEQPARRRGRPRKAAPAAPPVPEMAPSQAAPAADRFLRIEDVNRVTSLSRSEIYRRIELNEFPPGIKLGAAQSSRVVWIEREVIAWMHERIAEWRERMPT
jgi:prophage regulatory protein